MPKVYSLETPGYSDSQNTSEAKWSPGTPVIIDFGSRHVRTGTSLTDCPSAQFLTVAARFKDRKTGEWVCLAGDKILSDTSAAGAAKPAHDAGVVVNWDCVELLLDEAFGRAGVKSRGKVDAPVVLSESYACPRGPQKTFAELLFNGYGVPKLAFGVDAAFAYRYLAKPGESGIIVHSGYDATTLIPSINGVLDLKNARKISWGGRQAASYLQQLLALKYPYFPVRVTVENAEEMLKTHFYVAMDYDAELKEYLELPGLEERERIVQVPIVGGQPAKTEMELKAIEMRHEASSRRLKEIAEKAKAERLARNEEYLAMLEEVNTGDYLMLRRAGFNHPHQLEKAKRQAKANIRKAKGIATPPEEAEPEEAPAAPLADIPDDQLTSEQIKEKRRQKLLRGSWEARQRAKQEKQAEKERILQAELEDLEWRQKDFDGWVKAKREELLELQTRAQKRHKLKAALADRKSAEFKMRMKNITALASAGDLLAGENGNNDSVKRRKKDDEDDFGADDDDWQAYRLDDSDEEHEVLEHTRIEELQQELLEFDPTFTVDDLDGFRRDWRTSVIHKFLYGAHPFSMEDLEQSHQLNLNIERIRVPEVLFQPSLAGIDQAGVVECLANMLTRVFPQHTSEMAKNIYVSGGFNMFQGLCERLKKDLMAELPAGSEINVIRSDLPCQDAWKGMAEWAASPDAKQAFVTRQEFDANGPQFRKPHAYGNI